MPSLDDAVRAVHAAFVERWAGVCELAGITPKHLSSFLNGHNGMSLDLVDRVLLAVGRKLVLSTWVEWP
jgi:hypothetical protein